MRFKVIPLIGLFLLVYCTFLNAQDTLATNEPKGPSTGKYIVLIVVALVMLGAVLANKFKKKN
jgi:hypothetical protein